MATDKWRPQFTFVTPKEGSSLAGRVLNKKAEVDDAEGSFQRKPLGGTKGDGATRTPDADIIPGFHKAGHQDHR